jgi:hypothetical protein
LAAFLLGARAVQLVHLFVLLSLSPAGGGTEHLGRFSASSWSTTSSPKAKELRLSYAIYSREVKEIPVSAVILGKIL